MKATIKVGQEVDLNTLFVRADVRYWEDALVDGVEDTEGSLIPCRLGDHWCPEIDIETGVIRNWTKGVAAEIHYKVCDGFSCDVADAENKAHLSIDEEYVPGTMCPEESGYGDYIIMNVDADGKIANWHFDLTDFQTED